MSSLKLNKFGFLVAGVALLTLSVAQGCSSDDDSQAEPSGGSAGTTGRTDGDAGALPTGGDGGAGDVTGGGGDGGMGDVGGEAGEGGTGAVSGGGGSAVTAGAGGGAGGPTNCNGPNGCYACDPMTTLQFSNHCVTGGCPATFDNSKLTQIAKVGTL